jgi:hypothetical protein
MAAPHVLSAPDANPGAPPGVMAALQLPEELAVVMFLADMVGCEPTSMNFM